MFFKGLIFLLIKNMCFVMSYITRKIRSLSLHGPVDYS